MNNRTAIYCRCSTTNQNLETQRNDLVKYAESRGLEIIEIFEDLGFSGMKDTRPALDKMMLMARQRKFDFILIWRLDRLGRNTAHLLNLLDEFQELKISLVSHNEGFDLSTYMGRAMATILAALANFERNVTRERICSSLNNAKRKGIKLGRPSKFADTQKILELRAQNKSYNEISIKTGLSVGTVHGIVKKAIRAAMDGRSLA